MRAVWVAGLVVALTACGPGSGGSSQPTGNSDAGTPPTGGSDGGTPPLQQVRVSVAPASNGHGRVTSSPAGIDCPGSCITTVDAGTAMTLTAKADDDSSFGGWGGGCSGPGVCNLVASADVTVWVDFETKTPPPPPPTSCAGSTAAPPPTAVTASIDHFQRCEPGIGDATGTLGLGTRIGDTMSSAQQRNFYFYDAVSGSQKSSISDPGLDGSDDAYLAQASGFVDVVNVPQLLSTQVFDKDGKKVASGTSNKMVQGKGVFARAGFGGHGLLLAGSFNAATDDLKVATPHEVCYFADGAHMTWCRDLGNAFVVGVGMDAKNRTLVLAAGTEAGVTDGLWFDADGKPLADRFTVLTGFTPGEDTWFETAPLIGSDLAVRRVDQHTDAVGDYRTSQWLIVVTSGSAGLAAPPAWLKTRDNTDLTIVRSGKAYAILPLGAPNADCAQRIEVLAADGTCVDAMDLSTGSGKCRTADLAVSLDGTPIQVLPKSDPSAYTCSWRWWPGALK